MREVRIGLIGAGHRSYFIKAWNDTSSGSRITALAEIDDDAIEFFKNNFSDQIFITKDYRELLKREDVDAVVVLTPDYLHKKQAIDVLKSRKHLYLEKPMAITIEDCDEIIDCWKKSEKKMMMGLNMRYMEMYQRMYQVIKDGLIGDIKAIWVRHFVGTGGKMYFEDWHRNRSYTNSLLIQKGSHDFDMIHMLAQSYTKKVTAFGGLDFYSSPINFKHDGLEHRTNAVIDVEDNQVVILEMENGIKGAYLQCHFTPDYSRNYLIIGTKGSMENNDVEGTIKVKLRGSSSNHNQEELTWHIKKEEAAHNGADRSIVKAFIDYILEDKEPYSCPLDGRMSVAVGAKAAESLRQGGGVKAIHQITEEH